MVSGNFSGGPEVGVELSGAHLHQSPHEPQVASIQFSHISIPATFLHVSSTTSLSF